MEKWQIAAVIVVVLAIGFVWLYDPFKSKTAVAPETGTTLDENQDYVFGQLADPYLDRFQTLSDCGLVKDQEKTDCIIEVAKKTNTISLCDTLAPSANPWCKKEVFVQNHDTKSCDTLTEAPRNQCWYDISKKFFEIDPCKKITDPVMVNECVISTAIGKSDAEICEQAVSPEGRDNCYGSMAWFFEDPAFCDRVTDPDSKVDCQIIFEADPPEDDSDVDLSDYDNSYEP